MRKKGGVGVGLSTKQQAFVDEYLIDFNATQACIRAGYSERSARTTGARMLANANIQEAIAKRTQEKQSSLIADQEEILEMLTSIARGNEQNFSTKVTKVINGSVEERSSKGASTPQTEERLKALELLGKANAIFTDKVLNDNFESVTFVDDLGGDIERN